MSQTATLQREKDQALTRTIDTLQDLNSAYRGTRGFMEVFGEDESLREDLREIQAVGVDLADQGAVLMYGRFNDASSFLTMMSLLELHLDQAEEAFNLVK